MPVNSPRLVGSCRLITPALPPPFIGALILRVILLLPPLASGFVGSTRLLLRFARFPPFIAAAPRLATCQCRTELPHLLHLPDYILQHLPHARRAPLPRRAVRSTPHLYLVSVPANPTRATRYELLLPSRLRYVRLNLTPTAPPPLVLVYYCAHFNTHALVAGSAPAR